MRREATFLGWEGRVKRRVNDKLVSSQGAEGGLQRTKERHGRAEIARVYFLLCLATQRRGSKGREEKKSDQHHHCSVPNLIVQDPEHMLVYIRGTESPSCDAYGGRWSCQVVRENM